MAAMPMVMLGSLTLSDAGFHQYQQTTNNPCVIGDSSCNEPANFTYTQASGQPAGTKATYDLTSPTYTATSPFTTYSNNLIPTSFQIGIDDNYATGAGQESLEAFNTYNCTSGTCVLDTANSFTGSSSTLLSGTDNGNGYANNVLSTLNLTAGDTYKFEAIVDNDTDGMEQFFIIPATPVTNTPEPAAIALLGSSMIGLGAIVRRRRRNRLA